MNPHPSKSSGAFPTVLLCILLSVLTFIALSIRSCVRAKIQTIEQSATQPNRLNK